MKYYPTYLQSFGLLLIFLLSTILSLLVVMPFFSYESAIGMSLIYTLSIGLTIGGGLLIRQDFTFKLRGTHPMIVLLSSIAFVCLHIFLDPITSLIPLPEVLKKIFYETLQQPIPYFFMLVMAAPVLEELLFRGVILDGLLRNYKSTRAIAFSAFLFALVHGNLAQGVGAFFGGLLIGWVYWKTQSVIPGILIHMVNNLLAYTATLLTPKEDVLKNLSEEFSNPIYYWLVIVICGGITLICVWILYNRYLKTLQIDEDPNRVEGI
jgi:uncharacterized protein